MNFPGWWWWGQPPAPVCYSTSTNLRVVDISLSTGASSLPVPPAARSGRALPWAGRLHDNSVPLDGLR